jgi:hypothetical protein
MEVHFAAALWLRGAAFGLLKLFVYLTVDRHYVELTTGNVC